jgi:hypothetical protein
MRMRLKAGKAVKCGNRVAIGGCTPTMQGPSQGWCTGSTPVRAAPSSHQGDSPGKNRRFCPFLLSRAARLYETVYEMISLADVFGG